MCVEGEGKKRAIFIIIEEEVDGLYYFFMFYRAKKLLRHFSFAKIGRKETSFFAVTIRLLLHNSFSAAAMAAEIEGEGEGEGQNLNFSPGGGYNILPAIGCRNRQILCCLNK